MKIKIVKVVIWLLFFSIASRGDIFFDNIRLDSLPDYINNSGLSKFDRLFYKIVFTTISSKEKIVIKHSILDDFVGQYNKKQMIFYKIYKYKTSKNRSRYLKDIYYIYPDLLSDNDIYLLFKNNLNNKKIVTSIIKRVLIYNKNRKIKQRLLKFLNNNYLILKRYKNPEELVSVFYRLGYIKLAKRVCRFFAYNKRVYYLSKTIPYKNRIKYYKNNFSKFGKYKPYVLKNLAKLYRKKDKNRAIYYYEKLSKDYSKHSVGKSAIWYLGWYYELNGDFKKAKFYYNRLWHLKGSYSQDGLFRLGLLQYLEGDYLLAVSSWEKMLDSPKKFFWLAKAYQKSELPTRANYFKNKTIKYGSLLNYYTLNQIIESDYQIKFDTTSIVKKQISAHDKFLITMLDERLLYRFYKKTTNRVEIANFAIKRHKYWFANKIVYPVKFKNYYSDTSINVNFFKILFPRLFNKSLSEKELLLFAIAKQESQFYKYALSPVGARGIMQIMPQTAKKIIRAYNLKIPIDSLYKINYNITIGNLLINSLYKRYKGDFLKIISAYNAGGTRVDRWSKRLSRYSDQDIKIELVEFRETRKYLKKVLRNYCFYSLLYKKECEVMK